jgi:hypothetical protein
MTTNISLKTKIRVNGQDYGSVNDMPPEVRQAYELALSTTAGARHDGFLQTLEKGIRANAQVASNAKIVFNGHEYGSVDQMPANLRRLYQAVIAAVETGDAPIAPEAGGAVQPVQPNAGGGAPFPALPTASSVRPQSANWRLVLVAVAILLRAWLGFGRFIVSP